MQKQQKKIQQTHTERCLNLKMCNNHIRSCGIKLNNFQFDIAEQISLLPFVSRKSKQSQRKQICQVFKILKRPSKVSKYRSYVTQLKSFKIQSKLNNKDSSQQIHKKLSKINIKNIVNYLKNQTCNLDKPSLSLTAQRSGIILLGSDTVFKQLHQQSTANAHLISMKLIKSAEGNYEQVKQQQKIQEYSLKFKRMLQIYLLSIKINCKFHSIPFYRVQKCSKYSFRFQLLDNGNNSKLIRRLMNNRWWWKESKIEGTNDKEKVNFSWSQLKVKQYFQDFVQSNIELQQKIKNRSQLLSKLAAKNIQKLSQQSAMQKIKTRKIHNHFQHNQLLSSNLARHYLIQNLYKKSQKYKQTFLMSFYVQKFGDRQWQKFTDYYFNYIHSKGQNSMWILKPITVRKNCIIFRNYNQIKNYLKQQHNSRSFLLQKYISHPFLYRGRKFEVYCYLLITRLGSSLKAYLYEQGYVGTTSELYNPNMVDNIFMHFSNTYVQVQHDQFGLYQPGNKLNFSALQDYLNKNYRGIYSLRRKAFPKMKRIAANIVQSSCSLLKSNSSQFQLFQLQFTMDSEFNPWLKNISTNPCLQILCPTLQKIIPELIDDTFKLSIDLLFPAPASWPSNTRQSLSAKNHQNNFCLIFDEQSICRDQQINNKIPRGQFEEDIHTYEEDQLDYTTLWAANRQKY